VFYYLDTSALVKLVCEEPESEALRRWFVSDAQPKVTSDISRTELIRAVRRLGQNFNSTSSCSSRFFCNHRFGHIYFRRSFTSHVECVCLMTRVR
jgi:uncharacterized protein with PIN domain